MQQTVPLNKLVLSPRNVRKSNGDEDIAGLADSIGSKGLLQNLVVSPAESPKGVFEVDAGGRRLRALQLLAERKDLPKNWPVPVKIIAVVDARQASLAENLQKVAMNPADEVEAFAALIDDWSRDGMSQALAIANCSKRFGVTERYVRQRLALAALASDILDALRDGRITIAAATAYASHPDQAQQLKVFKAHEKRTGEYGKHDPRSIRDELKGRLYTTDHKLVRYIGLDAYHAAGGATAVDLFFAEEDTDREILLDTGLVEKLAAEKGAIEAQQLAQAEGWLDGALQPVVGHSWNVGKAPQGFQERWTQPAALAPEQRSETIAIYGIADDATLQPHANYVFVKVAPAEQRTPAHKPETAEEREARLRQEEIRTKAVKLAAPKATGTPFEGRLFFPPDFYHCDVHEDETDPDMVLVNIQLRIPKADIDAQMAEAERRYEFEQQELREEEEALAAERDGEGDEDGPDDGEFDDDVDQDPTVNDSAAAEPAEA